MFDVLSRGFKNARLKLQGKARLTEDNLAEPLREVRASLIQADVELGVVKSFLAKVKERSLGEVVQLDAGNGLQQKLTPQDHFIYACHEQLVELMGPVDTSLDLEGSPAVVLLVGLQGSGKTTTAGKLAKRLQEQGHRPLLVAADIYRPAAIDQLQVLGERLGVPVHTEAGAAPVQLARDGVARARRDGQDVVLIDTAGRLAIDEALMVELEGIKAAVRPNNVLFVVDAMVGQDGVKTAAEFDRRLDFDGFVLTKLDGDARGGVALSIKQVTGKPVKFLGQGEELDRLEEFRPEGLAQRILGFGDVVGLMQDFERHVDKDEAEAGATKMLEGRFDYEDFVKQMKSLRKLGPLKGILSRMPFLSDMMDQIPEEAFDERELDRTLAILSSMTRQERRNPDLLGSSRFERIARGCGRPVSDVRALHDRFLQARTMMAGLGGMMNQPGGLEALQKAMSGGGLPGFPGGFPGAGGRKKKEKPQVSAEEKLARRERQRDRRRAQRGRGKK